MLYARHVAAFDVAIGNQNLCVTNIYLSDGYWVDRHLPRLFGRICTIEGARMKWQWALNNRFYSWRDEIACSCFLGIAWKFRHKATVPSRSCDTTGYKPWTLFSIKCFVCIGFWTAWFWIYLVSNTISIVCVGKVPCSQTLEISRCYCGIYHRPLEYRNVENQSAPDSQLDMTAVVL